ncbi:hypothetical protein [uncultured Nostoc sp.]|uniref:hypothetical protein n=1 Tax=uncultured Nostoc sp. TaxID=340711 RepID=UPI0035CC6F72
MYRCAFSERDVALNLYIYQGMNISGVKNLDEAQMDALEELGASRDRKIPENPGGPN